MCGIAGIIYRHPQLYKNLGTDLLTLIQPLETRGPDSCGVGLYSNYYAPALKLLVASEIECEYLQDWLNQYVDVINVKKVGDRNRITIAANTIDLPEIKSKLAAKFPDTHIISIGQSLEIYKQVGTAANLFQKYQLTKFSGSHGIGHTRMATESIVDTNHSHPFTSALDLSIVHNGQISNYYKMRFTLETKGIKFETHNDSEAIAHYISYQLSQNLTLEAALNQLLANIDGTYTTLIATLDKVAIIRDKFAAKPAVIYETPEMVAIASEYRCFLNLPNYNPNAKIYEPDAGEIKIWSIK